MNTWQNSQARGNRVRASCNWWCRECSLGFRASEVLTNSARHVTRYECPLCCAGVVDAVTR